MRRTMRSVGQIAPNPVRVDIDRLYQTTVDKVVEAGVIESVISRNSATHSDETLINDFDTRTEFDNSFFPLRWDDTAVPESPDAGRIAPMSPVAFQPSTAPDEQYRLRKRDGSGMEIISCCLVPSIMVADENIERSSRNLQVSVLEIDQVVAIEEQPCAEHASISLQDTSTLDDVARDSEQSVTTSVDIDDDAESTSLSHDEYTATTSPQSSHAPVAKAAKPTTEYSAAVTVRRSARIAGLANPWRGLAEPCRNRVYKKTARKLQSINIQSCKTSVAVVQMVTQQQAIDSLRSSFDDGYEQSARGRPTAVLPCTAHNHVLADLADSAATDIGARKQSLSKSRPSLETKKLRRDRTFKPVRRPTGICLPVAKSSVYSRKTGLAVINCLPYASN